VSEGLAVDPTPPAEPAAANGDVLLATRGLKKYFPVK